MADATDLKSVDRKVVWVRLPPSAPFISITYRLSSLPLHHRNGVNSVAHLVFVQIAEKNRFLTSSRVAPSLTSLIDCSCRLFRDGLIGLYVISPFSFVALLTGFS